MQDDYTRKYLKYKRKYLLEKSKYNAKTKIFCITGGATDGTVKAQVAPAEPAEHKFREGDHVIFQDGPLQKS